MKNVQWIFLLYAVATTICLVGVGIAVAFRSTVGVIACIGLAITITGSGMMKKRKLHKGNQS